MPPFPSETFPLLLPQTGSIRAGRPLISIFGSHTICSGTILLGIITFKSVYTWPSVCSSRLHSGGSDRTLS